MKQYLELVQRIIDEGETRGDRTGTGTKSIFGTQTRYDLREGLALVTSRKINFSAVVKELLWFLRGETNTKTLDCKIWDEWAGEDGELGPIYGAQWRRFNETSIEFEGKTSLIGIDQIAELIDGLKENPESRRHIVSAWDPAVIDRMALPPCHTMFQCYASKIPTKERYQMLNDLVKQQISKLPDLDPSDLDFQVGESESFVDYNDDGLCNLRGIPKYYLDLQLYQRSGDMMLGVKCAPFRSDTT